MNQSIREIKFHLRRHLVLLVFTVFSITLIFSLIAYMSSSNAPYTGFVSFSESTQTQTDTHCSSYPQALFYDPFNDQAIPQNDITSVSLKQISNNALQVKVTVRGNPLDLRNSHYLVFIDADNNPDTGRYWPHWDMGDDLTIRMGYDEFANKWFAGAESIEEGFMQALPVLIKDNSFYTVISLDPYRPSYEFGNTIKFSVDVVNVPEEGDFVENTAVIQLSSKIKDENYKIITENEIFSSSPHSMYLDYWKRNHPISLSIENYSGNPFFFSVKSEIAEIIDGNTARTNFNITTEERNSDFSYISAYIPECDLVIEDFVMVLSATELFKGERAAFVMPTGGYNHEGTYVDLHTPLVKYDVEVVSSYAVQIQEELTGTLPPDGDNRIFAYNYPACGWAGLPIWLGAGCTVFKNLYDEYEPQWGFYYHELGHTMLTHIFSNKFEGLKRPAYSEGWASLNGMYTIHKLIKNKQDYNLSQNIVKTLQARMNDFRRFYVDDQEGGESLWKYENVYNNDFNKVDANIMDGMFIVLAEDDPILNPYGWEMYPRFYKVFLLEYWELYDDVGDGETFLVAALSAAAGHDLRPQFEDWNFPIDNHYFKDLLPILSDIINDISISQITATTAQYPRGRKMSTNNTYVFDQLKDTIAWHSESDNCRVDHAYYSYTFDILSNKWVTVEITNDDKDDSISPGRWGPWSWFQPAKYISYAEDKKIWIRLEAEDCQGNIQKSATFSILIDLEPNGLNNNPPIISSDNQSDSSIRWTIDYNDFDEFSHYWTGFYKGDNCDISQLVGNWFKPLQINPSGISYLPVDELDPNQWYSLMAVSCRANNICSKPSCAAIKTK